MEVGISIVLVLCKYFVYFEDQVTNFFIIDSKPFKSLKTVRKSSTHKTKPRDSKLYPEVLRFFEVKLNYKFKLMETDIQF